MTEKINYCIVSLGLLIGLLLAGCNAAPDETWYCYDENGNPIEGVLVVCRYGLPSYKKRAVDFRFSDKDGKVRFSRGKEIPRELRRGFDCTYSALLQSGGPGVGERWSEDKPIPDKSVYFDEYKNRIYIKQGANNPVVWHGALNTLLYVCQNVRKREMAMEGPGIEKLEEVITRLASKERELFLSKYGEESVPVAYLKSRRLSWAFSKVSEKDWPDLKFKDVTLPMP